NGLSSLNRPSPQIPGIEQLGDHPALDVRRDCEAGAVQRRRHDVDEADAGGLAPRSYSGSSSEEDAVRMVRSDNRRPGAEDGAAPAHGHEAMVPQPQREIG